MVNCPFLKAKMDKFKQRKTMCATWDELGGSDSQEDLKNEEGML